VSLEITKKGKKLYGVFTEYRGDGEIRAFIDNLFVEL
jgi:hypothetical protein